MTDNYPSKQVLHVGCGPAGGRALHKTFHGPKWREIRLDIDPLVEPDIVASIIDMHMVEDASVDAVWSSHNLEHLDAHEVPVALAEFRRVLKPEGFALIRVPDLQRVAAMVAEDKPVDTYYDSPSGPVTPMDVMYGHRASIAAGHHYMRHKTGFTMRLLAALLHHAGFAYQVRRIRYCLWATGYTGREPPAEVEVP